MILFARVENYRSIGKKQTLSFLANTDKSHKDILIEEQDYKILPVIPIYGGNATGKTNVLKFLKVLVEIVTGKIEIEEAYDPCKFSKEKKETIFEIVFIENEIKYYYKISYTDELIVEEGLYYYPKGKLKKIFHRKKNEFSFGESFETALLKYSENLSEKACFLNTISNFLGESTRNLNDVNKFFKENFVFINFDTTTYNTEKAKEIFSKSNENNEKIKEFITYFYTHMSIGVSKIVSTYTLSKEEGKLISQFIESEKTKKNLKKDQLEELRIKFGEENLINILASGERKMSLVYKTENGEVEIPIDEESEGIKKLFTLGIPLADALCHNKIVIFDELEIGFHPFLSKKVIELFLTAKNKAQLLFTTHNTNLLDLEIFRREQIYFASRTKETGFQTEIKSLGEIVGVRKSADIEKAYLEGKYCSTPNYKEFNSDKIGEILCL